MLSLSTHVGARVLALASSALVHVGAVAILSGHSGRPNVLVVAPSDAVSFELALLSAEATQVVVPHDVPRASQPARRAHSHTHAYPVAADHADHPHSASLVHAPIAALSARPTFAVELPAQATRPQAASAVPSGNESGRQSSSVHASLAGPDNAPDAIASEQTVDLPARLLVGGAPVYPQAASAAGIEADVPLEIVIDERGHVRHARALAAVGYGLEQAALTGVRAYRFQPALLRGRATAVRMKWTMLFRLQ